MPYSSESRGSKPSAHHAHRFVGLGEIEHAKLRVGVDRGYQLRKRFGREVAVDEFECVQLRTRLQRTYPKQVDVAAAGRVADVQDFQVGAELHDLFGQQTHVVVVEPVGIQELKLPQIGAEEKPVHDVKGHDQAHGERAERLEFHSGYVACGPEHDRRRRVVTPMR
eukprot:3932664-Rhodomonas_salina.1